MPTMLRINKIRIRNFRSIRDLTLSPKDMSILVGKNDTGKSNIMRALNLFFNGSATHEEPFDFDCDHNVHNEPIKKAKQIVIRLEIQLPSSYRPKNGDFIIWEKCWRAEGLKYSKRYQKNGKDLPPRSRVGTLLDRIKFMYVPAIRDSGYFSHLQTMIYSTISDVWGERLHASSKNFEVAISDEIKELISEISSVIKIDSQLTLPKDMGTIFSNLEFRDGKSGILLSSRGDGVKAQHIPLILSFIAKIMHNSPSMSYSIPYNIIWGYEEPENSLELSSCVTLADKFLEISKGEDICQIFVTTHSPVFYNITAQDTSESDDNNVIRYFVYNKEENDSTEVTNTYDNMDERMGTTAALGKIITGIERRVRQTQNMQHSVEDFSRRDMRVLFVEGTSDKIFYKRVFQKFAPDIEDKLRIETYEGPGAGDGYVLNMLASWELWARHSSKGIRVAGLIDLDSGEKRKQKKEWDRFQRKAKFAKSFCAAQPPHMKEITDSKFMVPINLETLYDLSLWEYAMNNKYLQPRKNGIIVPKKLRKRVLEGRHAPLSLLEKENNYKTEWRTILSHEFRYYKKVDMASYVTSLPDEDFETKFGFLRITVNGIKKYLFG